MGIITKSKKFWHKSFDEIIAEQMIRYFFIQKLYPLLELISQFYFIFINRIFALLNLTKSKAKVEWTEKELANPLLFMSAKKAAEKIRNKEIKSEDLIFAYINRIRSVQPLVNAVVTECYEQAIEDARKVDQYLANLDENSEEYQNLAETKPLLGVPFSLKNNMNAKGFVTICGYGPNLENAPAEKDATVVERLRHAGAILICLTNMPKLAMNWITENQVHGRTSNPYDLRRVPGGSSGGEGALIGAGASIFGLGNDLGGSVRIPAFMGGVFGLKPTKDAVSLDGFVPPLVKEAERAQWTIGPLCRYAEDLPIVFGIISDKPQSEMMAKFDFSQIRVLYLDELNIWFIEKVHAEMRQALKKSVRYFETEFNTMAQKVDFPLAHHFLEIWGAIGFGNPAPTVLEILKQLPKIWNGTSPMTSCAWTFSILHCFVETRNEQEKEFMLQKLDKLRQQIIRALGDDGILILPTWPTVAPFHWQQVFTPYNVSITQIVNVLGFPAVACPLGLDPASGLPVGVQILGPPNSEPLLMAAAMELEKGFGGWVRP